MDNSLLPHGSEWTRQQEFWHAVLAPPLPRLDGLADYERPPTASYIRGTETCFLEEQVCTRAALVVGRCSPAIPLLAGISLVLSRCAGQKELVVGTASPDSSDGRKNYVNPVALRIDLSGDLSGRKLLERADATARESAAHRDYPFDLLADQADPGPLLNRSPIFQVMFLPCGMQGCVSDASVSDEALDEVEACRARCDLVFTAVPAGARVELRCDYDAALFEPGKIRAILSTVVPVLSGVGTAPDLPVRSLPWLDREARRKVLVEWNSTEMDYASDVCVHELVEAQVRRMPDAVALVHEGTRWTYAQLDARASAIARALRELGVAPEVPVAVSLNRTPDLVAAILGVLKAGGAYVPLDPAYPEERTALILADTGAPLVLTCRALAGLLPMSGARPVCVDDIGENTVPHEERISRARADNLSYILFTSGSTGTPKGVAVPHRNVVSFLEFTRNMLAPLYPATVFASTSVCFDFSVFELFAPLYAGGRIVLAENLFELPEAAGEKVQVVSAVPSAMAELLRTRPLPGSVGIVLLGGEPLQPALVDRLYEQRSVTDVIDLYGPTETTVYATCARRTTNAPATIGRPIANTRIYVVDDWLEPVPVGFPGEICIGGDNVARCYFGRPDRTAESFVPDPFRGVPGSRMYRTGDFGRYRTDGNLEFIGRRDNQVKIRGVRIELGEVETALHSHPAVLQAAATTQRDSRGEQELAAYVVADPNRPLRADDLRRFLRRKLPAAMVPAFVVILDRLPRTSNGKVDRSALPRPLQTTPSPPGPPDLPRTETERLLADLWRRVLGVEQVGIRCDFFDMGGQSLLALRLAGSIQAALQLKFSARLVFENPTVEKQARAIEEMRAGTGSGQTG